MRIITDILFSFFLKNHQFHRFLYIEFHIPFNSINRYWNHQIGQSGKQVILFSTSASTFQVYTLVYAFLNLSNVVRHLMHDFTLVLPTSKDIYG